MKELLKRGVTVWRTIAGPDTAIEHSLKRQYLAARSRIQKKYVGDNFSLFWSGPRPDPDSRIGIYMKGDCHLLSIFACQPLIQQVLNGACCILKEGLVSDSRSDLLLQTRQHVPKAAWNPVTERLKLSADYFRPRLFDRHFAVPSPNGSVEFPKTAVVLSIGSDVTRTLYRHREHGFLVDPGELWFGQSVNSALADLSAVAWFRDNFSSVGRIGVDRFSENLATIIDLLRRDTGAHILVFNVLTLDPGNLTHNYQFVKQSPAMRRREFNLALVELSRKLDFPIVDLDRILKRVGTGRQLDFAHFPPELARPVAEEAFGIMRDLRIL